MSINITLTPAEERKLADLARANGRDLEGYAHDVVAAYLRAADATGTRTIEQIVAPLWDAWRRSGMTDAEVDDLLEEELHATRAERRSGTAP